METLPVQEVPGIGKKMRASLDALGIATCGELGRADAQLLETHFGFWGHWLKRWSRGEDSTPVLTSAHDQAAKSVGHSTTLPQDTSDPKVIDSFILLLSEMVAARLRKAGQVGSTVSLVIRYSDFETVSKSRTFKEPTAQGSVIHQHASDILKRFRLKGPLRLLGVSIASLSPATAGSYLLPVYEKAEKAARAMDAINRKYGKWTLKKAGVMRAEDFGVLEPPIPPKMKVRPEGPGQPRVFKSIEKR